MTHDGMLVALAALAGLVEGPAQILCVAVLLLAAITGRWVGSRSGVFFVAVGVWVAAGYLELGGGFEGRSGGEMTRPLMALAAMVGAGSLAGSAPRTLGRVAWAFGIAITLNAAYGLVQIGLGMDPLEARIHPEPRLEDRMAFGIFRHRLRLAQIGSIGLALAGVVVTAPEVRRGTRWAAGLSLAVLVPAVLGTYLRTPWVGFTVAVVAYCVLIARPGAALASAAGGLVASVVLRSTSLGARRWASWPDDWIVRTRMFSAGFEVFLDHPWFGVGHGGYRAAVAGVSDLSGVQRTSPHNLAVQALAETGAVGAAALAVAFGLTLWRLGRGVRARRGAGGAHVRLERVAFLGFSALLATGFTHFTLHHAAVGLVFWTLAGVAHRR